MEAVVFRFRDDEAVIFVGDDGVDGGVRADKVKPIFDDSISFSISLFGVVAADVAVATFVATVVAADDVSFIADVDVDVAVAATSLLQSILSSKLDLLLLFVL